MGESGAGPSPVDLSTRCVWCVMLAKMVDLGGGPTYFSERTWRLGGWKGASGKWEITGPKGKRDVTLGKEMALSSSMSREWRGGP